MCVEYYCSMFLYMASYDLRKDRMREDGDGAAVALEVGLGQLQRLPPHLTCVRVQMRHQLPIVIREVILRIHVYIQDDSDGGPRAPLLNMKRAGGQKDGGGGGG